MNRLLSPVQAGLCPLTLVGHLLGHLLLFGPKLGNSLTALSHWVTISTSQLGAHLSAALLH